MDRANEIDALRRRSDALASHPLAPWMLRGAYVVLAACVAMALWMSMGHVAAGPAVVDAAGRGTASARENTGIYARQSSRPEADGPAAPRD